MVDHFSQSGGASVMYGKGLIAICLGRRSKAFVTAPGDDTVKLLTSAFGSCRPSPAVPFLQIFDWFGEKRSQTDAAMSERVG